MSDRTRPKPRGTDEVDPTLPALTPCPDCQRPVSEAAERCPVCGCPRSRMAEVREAFEEKRSSGRCALKCELATDTLAPSYVCTGSHRADRIVFGVSQVLEERDMPRGGCEEFTEKVLTLFGAGGSRQFRTQGYGFGGEGVFGGFDGLLGRRPGSRRGGGAF